MTVTQIEAGTQHNVVPDTCRFVVDVRVTDAYAHEEILRITSYNVCYTKLLRIRREQQADPAVDRALGLLKQCLDIPCGRLEELCFVHKRSVCDRDLFLEQLLMPGERVLLQLPMRGDDLV